MIFDTQNEPVLADNGLDIRRQGRITGSSVAAILGISPYQTRNDVLRDKVREYYFLPSEFTGNIATQWGKDNEQNALSWYESLSGNVVTGQQTFIIHPVNQFLCVTIDGAVSENGKFGLVEAKCPYRSQYQTIPEYYLPQVQLQMACAGADFCDFICWRADGSGFVQRIDRDPIWLDSVLPELRAFMLDFSKALWMPELTEKYLADKERSDDAWSLAAETYITTKAKIDKLTAVLEASKQRMIDLSDSSSAKGCGVSLIRTEKSGSIAYAKAIKALLPDADLSAWHSEPSVVYSVRLDKV